MRIITPPPQLPPEPTPRQLLVSKVAVSLAICGAVAALGVWAGAPISAACFGVASLYLLWCTEEDKPAA